MVRVKFVSVCVRVTVAWGITAPVESVMEPNMVAVLSCALPLPQNIADRTTTRKSFQLFDRMSVDILRPREISVCLMFFVSTRTIVRSMNNCQESLSGRLQNRNCQGKGR